MEPTIFEFPFEPRKTVATAVLWAMATVVPTAAPDCHEDGRRIEVSGEPKPPASPLPQVFHGAPPSSVSGVETNEVASLRWLLKQSLSEHGYLVEDDDPDGELLSVYLRRGSLHLFMGRSPSSCSWWKVSREDKPPRRSVAQHLSASSLRLVLEEASSLSS